MLDITTKTIREIALEDPATTRVFEEFSIDYCCGGRRSIGDACADKGIDPAIVVERLERTMELRDVRGEIMPERLRPAELVDYIVANHHTFTRREIERLSPLTSKVATRHGESRPELVKLEGLFKELVESLVPHMSKEEEVLFPYIRELQAAADAGSRPPVPRFGTVKNPIAVLMEEHDEDGARLAEMRELTHGYLLPDGACPSFTALYAGLADLERDLHRHVHLENNVLFPAAAILESR